ncbi:lysosomal amino acid transporter 1 homolog isoform X2 [Rhineura floridana]|uniref:lysosomal amino acid transporter 1 homolog isoform X2 n=1 Tax=Rhineura floridana TaxID=261503 RepID=UPI002AC879FB|nr:lysosomal amino acid transporter 1 homolog isoform X2 [Rhineura floridana]
MQGSAGGAREELRPGRPETTKPRSRSPGRGVGPVCELCGPVASQYYLACKTGIMDQALSVYFLLGWLGGDSLNLIGSFLADQLPLQVYTAIYYVLADLLMISFYLYYKIKNQNRSFSASINTIFVFLFVGTVSVTSFLGGPTSRLGDGTSAFKGRTLLSSAEDQPWSGWEPFTKREIVGFVVGSISSLLYLLSRVPQIYTNFKRKSTSGISYSLFALVMLGNTLYGVSVLLKNPDPGQAEGSYVIHHLPWLIGSLGVLSLDIVISFQFLAYRQRRLPPLEERDALLGKEDEPLDS